MKVYVSFSYGYALALCFFSLISFSVLAVVSNAEIYTKIESEIDRENYLSAKGYSVSEPFSVKDIVVNGENFTEYTYITTDKNIIRMTFDGNNLVGERYDRYKTG